MGTMKDLEGRMASLEDRVAHVEQQAGIQTPEDLVQDQVAKDRDTVSRHPTTYAEAVEFEAATKRLEELPDDSELGDDNPAQDPES